MSRTPHPRGCPATRCECGFYALHALPSINEELDRAIWEIDSATSGGRHGLVLGVVAGYGRTSSAPRDGDRASARSSLYAGPAVGPRRDVQEAAATYDVPLYRNLDAMVSEWGPDRDAVASLIA